MTESDQRPNYHTHALTRGLQVLEIVAGREEPTTLGDLHELSGFPKSTIVRLLSTLADTDYLVRVDDRPAYVLGPRVADLTQSYVSQVDVADLVRPRLTELAAATNQTANLAVLDGASVLHVAVVAPDRPLYFDANVGDRAPTYGTGLGKALLSSLADDEVSRHLPPQPWRPGRAGGHVLTHEGLLEDLRRTRKNGYAFDDNEFAAGLRCLAVSLPRRGRSLAALSVSGPSGEFTKTSKATFVGLLQDCASELAADPSVVAALDASPRRRS